MKRPSLHEYYLGQLLLLAARGTCRRRKVAAIIVDEQGKVLSTGYNGPPRGVSHCVDTPCAGAFDKPGDNSNCMATHAEQNALLQCTDLSRAFTMYCSCTPCFACAKMIANTKINTVVVREAYADKRGEAIFQQASIMLLVAGADELGWGDNYMQELLKAHGETKT